MFPVESGRTGWFPQVRVIEVRADLACARAIPGELNGCEKREMTPLRAFKGLKLLG